MEQIHHRWIHHMHTMNAGHAKKRAALVLGKPVEEYGFSKAAKKHFGGTTAARRYLQTAILTDPEPGDEANGDWECVAAYLSGSGGRCLVYLKRDTGSMRVGLSDSFRSMKDEVEEIDFDQPVMWLSGRPLLRDIDVTSSVLNLFYTGSEHRKRSYIRWKCRAALLSEEAMTADGCTRITVDGQAEKTYLFREPLSGRWLLTAEPIPWPEQQHVAMAKMLSRNGWNCRYTGKKKD